MNAPRPFSPQVHVANRLVRFDEVTPEDCEAEAGRYEKSVELCHLRAIEWRLLADELRRGGR